MKWMSFNCRGMANPAKTLALKRLFELEKLDVIFLQENMGNSKEVVSFLEAKIKDCFLYSLDAKGRSGGIALGINR